MNVLEEAGKLVPMRLVSSHKGGEYHGECPCCGGKDRFHVWPEQNDGQGSFWCRQCGKGGDLIQFLIDFCGKSFPEAAKLAGKEIDATYQYRAPRPPKDSRRPEAFVPTDPTLLDRRVGPWKEKAAKFVGWANTQLLKSSEMLGWLAARGIDQQSAVEFKLGWNPGKDGKDLFRTRESWGLNTVTKADGRKKRLWLPKGIVIPYVRGEEIIRVRIRRFETEGPRYYFVPGGSPEIMVLGPNAKAHVVVESELDGILVFQECRDIEAGAIAMGSSHAKPDKPSHMVLSGSLSILNALDFDQAGAKASSWWEEQYPRCERWPVPIGKDPGEAYQAGIDIREWVRAGLPPAMLVAPSRLLARKSEASAESDAPEQRWEDPEEGTGNAYPDSVNELWRYLRSYPVQIKNTPTRLRIVCPEAWESRNWGLSKKISSLIFMDPDCLEYLSGHPERLITGKNFLRTEKG